MAEKDDENLIGYDPLAWMQEQQTERQPSTPEAVGLPDSANESVKAMPDFASANAWMKETDSSDDAAQSDVDGNDACQIVLDSTLGMQNVAELHETFLRALDQGDKIEIDASAVQQIDTSSLQLLLILKRSAITLSKEVSIDFPSERFIEAATLLGLAEMLEIDQAASGFF